MIFRAVFFILVLFTLAPMAHVAVAQSAPPAQFLTSLPDIPLMPGLVELPDQTVAFDKPSGRIIESVLQIKVISKDEIRRYYESVLPRFGWSRIDGNVFARAGERLQMSFEDYEDEHFLRIIVIPQ